MYLEIKHATDPQGFKGEGNFIVRERTTEISTSPVFTFFSPESVNCII